MGVRNKTSKIEAASRFAEELAAAQGDPGLVGSILRQARKAEIPDAYLRRVGVPEELSGSRQYDPSTGRYRQMNTVVSTVGDLATTTALPDKGKAAYPLLASRYSTMKDDRLNKWQFLEPPQRGRSGGSGAVTRSAVDFRRRPGLRVTALAATNYSGNWVTLSSRPGGQGAVDALSAPYGRHAEVDTPPPAATSWEPYTDHGIEDTTLVLRRAPLLQANHTRVTAGNGKSVAHGFSSSVSVTREEFFVVNPPDIVDDPAMLEEIYDMNGVGMADMAAPAAGFLVARRTLQVPSGVLE